MQNFDIGCLQCCVKALNFYFEQFTAVKVRLNIVTEHFQLFWFISTGLNTDKLLKIIYSFQI